MRDITTVLREDGTDGLSLYILGRRFGSISMKTGSSEFRKMYDSESSEEIAVSLTGEFICGKTEPIDRTVEWQANWKDPWFTVGV